MFELALAAQSRSPDKAIKTVMTWNTEIKHGDPGERTISIIVDMGAGSTYLQSRQPDCT